MHRESLILYTLSLMISTGCAKDGQESPEPAPASAPAGPRHVCPTTATGSLGGARAPSALVAVFEGVPQARILDRGYQESMDSPEPRRSGPGFTWTAGTLDPVSGDPPPGGLTLDTARARLKEVAAGATVSEKTSTDNRSELRVELPSTPTHHTSIEVSAFYSDVRTVTFTCLETRTDLAPPTLGELNEMGALPVELSPEILAALGPGAVVRRLSGRVGLNLTLESDRDRPARFGAALEAEGFIRQGEPPRWAFERSVNGQRHSAMIAGNGGTLTLMLGGLHSTFAYR